MQKNAHHIRKSVEYTSPEELMVKDAVELPDSNDQSCQGNSASVTPPYFKDQVRNADVPSAIGVHIPETAVAPPNAPNAFLDVDAVLEESGGRSSHGKKHLFWALVGTVVSVGVASVVIYFVFTERSIPMPSPTQSPTNTTFEQGFDGWSLGGDGISLALSSNGYISGTDGQTGVDWFFVAPKKFLGHLIDCRLQFELKQDKDDRNYRTDHPRVIFGSSGSTNRITLIDKFPDPGLSFTKYEYVLSPVNESWFYVSPISGLREHEAISSEVVRDTLANVNYLAILGEYSASTDTGSLDNVFLSC